MQCARKAGLALVVCSLLALAATAQEPAQNDSSGLEYWRSAAGTLAMVPNGPVLEELGLRLDVVSQTDISDRAPALRSVFAALDAPGIELVTYNGRYRGFVGGRIQTIGEILLASDQAVTTIGDLAIAQRVGGEGSRWYVHDRLNDRVVFDLMPSGMVDIDRDARTLAWAGLEVYLSEEFAESLGVRTNGGAIGVLFFNGDVEPIDEVDRYDGQHEIEEGDFEGFIGCDIILAAIFDSLQWGTFAGQSSYSWATASCNIGDETCPWVASNPDHPVIGQQVYMHDPTNPIEFRMIGLGWLKHGFCAIDLNRCDPCVDTTGCEALSVGCSDPYSAFLNGNWSDLGPRFQINASTGEFPYPPAGGPTPNVLARRTILDHADIDPDLNPEASYFVEGVYISRQDTLDGNRDNNVSVREVRFASGTFNSILMGTTEREKVGLLKWADLDPAAKVVQVSVAADGNYYVGYKASDNGDGTWHYQYTIYNQNSHDSVRSFQVPVPQGVTVTNAQFHDVHYHSGEPYVGTDWTFERRTDEVSWFSETMAENVNANALRWSTAYSFCFDANTAPQDALADCDQFRTPNNFKFAVQAPSPAEDDFALTLDITTDDPDVARGEVFFADASVMTDAGMPDTDVRFQLCPVQPDGTDFGGCPTIDRTKTIPGGVSKTRTVRFRVPIDGMVGEWKLRLTAERIFDGVNREVEVPFNVE